MNTPVAAAASYPDPIEVARTLGIIEEAARPTLHLKLIARTLRVTEAEVFVKLARLYEAHGSFPELQTYLRVKGIACGRTRLSQRVQIGQAQLRALDEDTKPAA